MTRTTRTDYETTEVEVHGFECDNCGGFFTDEDDIVTNVQIPGDHIRALEGHGGIRRTYDECSRRPCNHPRQSLHRSS